MGLVAAVDKRNYQTATLVVNERMRDLEGGASDETIGSDASMAWIESATPQVVQGESPWHVPATLRRL